MAALGLADITIPPIIAWDYVRSIMRNCFRFLHISSSGWWEILMPKRVVLCTWSLPGLGWAYALRFPGNDEFSIDFPEEKEEKKKKKKKELYQGPQKGQHQFLFCIHTSFQWCRRRRAALCRAAAVVLSAQVSARSYIIMTNVMEFTFPVYKMVGGWWTVQARH